MIYYTPEIHGADCFFNGAYFCISFSFNSVKRCMRIKLILSDERKPRGYLFLAQIFLLLWLEWISSLFMFHNRDAIEILGVTSKANMQEKTPR